MRLIGYTGVLYFIIHMTSYAYTVYAGVSHTRRKRGGTI
jgi:hypothetical protein